MTATAIRTALLDKLRSKAAVKSNWTIQKSSQFGHTDVVRLLLVDSRLDPTVDDNYAILISCENGHAAVVQLLLADGRADPTADNNYALWTSSWSGYADLQRTITMRSDRAAGMDMQRW